MARALNEFDLAFICDTTGSMGGFLKAAQKRMVTMIDELSVAADVQMRLAVVEYRDHPPQDSVVSRTHPFTSDMDAARKAILALQASGGGDGPEAVFDGIVAACHNLAWRPHARRIAVLVGDAPPHGVGVSGDAFHKGCPCGETIDTVSAKAEEARVTLYALGLTSAVTESFTRLCRFTGGTFFPSAAGDSAMTRLKEILVAEFSQLDLDRKVLDAWTATPEPSVEQIAATIETNPRTVAVSITRLATRGLLA